ncbi:MAG: hypothetical protein HWD92_02875 [Flavobacteriia bacterium]|nr:hypothetical protein [Flavobacteriia bacterium]
MSWIATTFLLISSVAQQGDSLALSSSDLLESAEVAFQEEEYQLAYDQWEEYANTQTLPSADLYYNMGNAAWRMEEWGEAIWRWNQALKLNPDMEDAQHNLELAESKKVDRIKEEEVSPLTYVLELIYLSLSPNSWAVIAVLFALCIALMMALRRYGNGKLRSTAPVLAIISLVLCLLSVTLAFAHQYHLDNNLYAVVLNANVHVKSAPMPGAADAFIIHEGSEMKVMQTVGEWYEIRLNDGKVGWVKSEQVGVY